jgi:hypothetical protein
MNLGQLDASNDCLLCLIYASLSSDEFADERVTVTQPLDKVHHYTSHDAEGIIQRLQIKPVVLPEA